MSARALLNSRPVASTACFGLHYHAVSIRKPVLLLSVPRRLLQRAVDRNLVRRIARESLRAACDGAGAFALMLRLKRLPAGFDAMALRARKLHWRSELDSVFCAGLRGR